MAAVNGAVRAQSSAVARLLEAPRYEVIPVSGIEEKVAALPRGATVTVTASPRHGIERTIDVSARLAGRGYRVVPHLAARMIADRGQLERIVAHLEAAGIHEAFVVGGDASPPAGGYADAGDLLDELGALPHSLTRIGVGGYPEGHPLIPDGRPARGPAAQAAVRRLHRHAALLRRGGARALGPRDPGGGHRTARDRRPARAWSSAASSPRSRSRPASALPCATSPGTDGRSPRWRARGATIRRRSRGRSRRSAEDAGPRHRRRAPVHLQPGRGDGGLGPARLVRVTGRAVAARRSPTASAGSPADRSPGPVTRARRRARSLQRGRRPQHRAEKDERHADGDAQRERLAEDDDAEEDRHERVDVGDHGGA